MVAAAHAVLQPGEYLPQGGVAEAADRLRGQLEVAVVGGHVTLLLQLALQAAQCLEVVDRLPAQGPADRFLVHVVHAGAGVLLAQRGLQVGQVCHLGDRGGCVAQAEGLAAAAHSAYPALRLAQLRSPLAQGVAERGHLRGQPGVFHGLGHQVGQFLALLVRQRVHQPFGRLHPADEGVDQLLQVLRAVREHVAVLAHEVVEVLLGVLAAGVGVEHLAQVGHHVLDPLHGRRVGVLQGLLHALELAVEHLAAQQVAQLLELLPGLLRAPVVLRQLADGPRGVARQRVELCLAHPRVVARVGEQRPALGFQSLVEQLAGLFQHAVQAAGVAQLALPLADSAHQVVEAAPFLPAAAQQVTQRVARGVAAQDPVAHLVERFADVIGRRQRVRAVVVGTVTVIGHRQLLLARHSPH